MSKEVVLDLIKKSEQPVGVADIVKQSNLPKEEVSKAFDQLKKEDKIYSPIRCKYLAK